MKKNKLLLISSLIFVLAHCSAGAQGVLLGYNTTYPFPAQPAEGDTWASSFTVGAQDVDITSVQFILNPAGNGPSGSTTGYILSDSGGLPGAVIGSSYRSFASGQLNNGGFQDYPFTTPLELSAGDTYWVAYGSDSVGMYVTFTRNLSEFEGFGITPSLAGTASSFYPPYGWGPAPESWTLAYQLEGSVVPEPGSLAMSLMGLGLFSMRTWLGKRNGNIL